MADLEGPVAPQGPTTTWNRNALRILAVVAVLGGFVCIVAPFGSWMRIGFAGQEASVNGFGGETSDFDDENDEGDGSGGLIGRAEDSEGSDDSDDLDWLVSPVPDGAPIAVLGALVAALSLLLLRRVTVPRPDPERSRREVLRATGAIAIGAGLGFGWIVVSWFNLDRQWDDAISKSLEDDELGFAALFAAGIDFKPGYGLLLAGLATLGIGATAAAAFSVSFFRMEQMPIAVTITTTPPAPPADPPPAQPPPDHPDPPPLSGDQSLSG